MYPLQCVTALYSAGSARAMHFNQVIASALSLTQLCWRVPERDEVTGSGLFCCASDDCHPAVGLHLHYKHCR